MRQRCDLQAIRAFLGAGLAHCARRGPAGADPNPRPCLYVAGVPGTGKTATVLEVARELHGGGAAAGRQGSKAGGSRGSGAGRRSGDTTSERGFIFVEINALRLQTPAHLYSELFCGLTGA